MFPISCRPMPHVRFDLADYLKSKYTFSLLFDFAEGTGNPIDKSGNGRDGIANGGSYVVTAEDYGFLLNGSSDNITFSSYYPPNGTYSFVWIASADIADFGSVNRSIFQIKSGSTKGFYIDIGKRPTLVLSSSNIRTWNTIYKWLDGNPHVYELYIPGSGQTDINNATLTIDGVTIGVYSTQATGAQDAWNVLRIGRTEYAYWKGIISMFGISTNQITEDISLAIIADRKYNYLYKSDATTYRIYQRPDGNRWFVYSFIRTTDAGISEDSWRLSGIHSCDFSPVYEPRGAQSSLSDSMWVDSSQVDHALYVSGASPAWAGGIHGYEQVQSIAFYVDGVEQTLTSGKMLPGKDITIIQNTNILDPDDLSVLATSQTTYQWLENDLYLTDRIIFQKDKEIRNWYWPMAPFVRGAGFTTRGQLSGNAEQDISVSGFDIVRDGVASCRVWNDTNGFEMTVEVLNPAVALNSFAWSQDLLTFITNDALYNKLYFTLIGDTKRTIPSGTDITCQSKFSPRWAT